MTARSAPDRPLRLHVGSGGRRLDGWVNIDRKRLPGVDRVLDVRRGLPYTCVEAVFAEHFLEHLTLDEARRFLADCRRVLAPGGILRISTPNLDWVVGTCYHGEAGPGEPQKVADAVGLNRAFRGWGHRFLYNDAMLLAALREAGFAEIAFQRYGRSASPELSNLEGHERSPDTDLLPHVLIVEARGNAIPVKLPAALLDDYERDLLDGSPEWKKWVWRIRQKFSKRRYA
jgi:predicted SAM-dependent methyltransferase